MLTLAACALTLRLIASAHEGNEANTAAHIADHYALEGVVVTKDGGVLIVDPVRFFKHRSNVQRAFDARVAGARAAGVDPDINPRLFAQLQEEAECDADELLYR